MYESRDGLAHLLPDRLIRASTSVGTDPSWVRWREAMRGLETWRARQASRKGHDDGAQGSRVRDWLAQAGLHGTVVDVGAKDGGRRALLTGIERYIGIDPRPIAPTNASDDCALLGAFAEALPLRNASLDSAICLSAFDYFPDGPGAVGEIARVLKPGAPFAMLVSVVRATVARARGEKALPSRLLGTFLAAREIGARAATDLAAEAIFTRNRAHTHYYTRAQALAMLGVHFETSTVLEWPMPSSSILAISSRKRRTTRLTVLR